MPLKKKKKNYIINSVLTYDSKTWMFTKKIGEKYGTNTTRKMNTEYKTIQLK